jgi:hypothetical protein
VAILLALTGLLLRSPRVLAQPAPVLAPTVLDLVVLGAVVLGAAVGMIVRWVRPFSLVILGCVAVATIAGAARTPLLLIALPAGAVMLGAAVDAATDRSGARRHVRRLVPRAARITASAMAVLLAGAVLAVTVPQVGASATTGPAAAVNWLRAQGGTAAVLADDAVWTAANDPGGLRKSATARVLRYRDADWLTAPAGTAGTVLLVGRAPHSSPGTAGSLAAAARAWARSVRIAGFGPTQVRLAVPSVAAYDRQVAADRRERRTAATALRSTTPQLELSAPAARALATGEVDGRLLTVLAALAAGHRVGLAELPAVPGESGPYSLRRQARIVTFDAVPVAAGTENATKLRQWLTAQLPPYQPLISVDSDGLTLRYPAPSPLGLLSSS